MYCYYPQQDINYVMHQTALSNYSTYTNIAHDVLNNNETPFATRMIELQRCTSYDVNKIKLLKTVVEQVIDTGCVIYCAFIDSVKIVQALLDSMGIESKVISGEVSDVDREHVKSWFKQDASNKVLIITSAGGASLNLQVTPHLIFYETPWGVGNVLQVLGRVCRMFSEFKKFFIHFICAMHTVDIYKTEMVSSYSSITQGLLNNNYIPKGALPDYNRHMIASMRKDLCWCT
jgi:SNF2 family DNA or RNA helicase